MDKTRKTQIKKNQGDQVLSDTALEEKFRNYIVRQFDKSTELSIEYGEMVKKYIHHLKDSVLGKMKNLKTGLQGMKDILKAFQPQVVHQGCRLTPVERRTSEIEDKMTTLFDSKVEGGK